MSKLLKIIVATSFMFAIALHAYNYGYLFNIGYSAEVEQKEVVDEEPTKKVEEPEKEKEEESSNSKVLFYSGIFLLIVLVGAMLIIFLAKVDE